MHPTSTLGIFPYLLLALGAELAGAQVVPDHSVTVYATVTDPVHLSFDRGTGALHTERENAASGGGNGDAVRIDKIASGGSPVTEYSTTAIPDPEEIFFDAAGTASEGAAGSVIVSVGDLTTPTGTVRLFNSAGPLIDASYVTGVAGGALAVEPGAGFGTSLYLVDRTPGTLIRVDGSGLTTTIGTGCQQVAEIEFGPNGALYAADFNNDRILRIEPDFPAVWDASTTLLPDESCPAWSLTDTAVPEDPVLASNLLTLTTSANAENMRYLQTAPEISMPTQFILEARMRFVSGSSSFTNRAPASIIVTTAANVGTTLHIGLDEIFLTADGDVKGPSAAVQTDDALHTYRIVIDGTATGSPVTVFRDGVLTLTGATFIDPANNGPVERVLWGEASIGTFGVHEWAFVRHNAAVCVPATPTTTTTSTTTTTTLPPGCGGFPDGASFSSITCRLTALRDRVGAESGLGTFQKRLGKALTKAGKSTTGAETACGTTSRSALKKTRKQLGQAAESLTRYTRALASHSARKKLDGMLRQKFLDAAAAITADVTTLRGLVRCPPPV